MKNRIRTKLFTRAAELFFVFLFVLSLNAFADTPGTDKEQPETIYISTADDLLKLAKDCRYDVWSKNRRVVLQNDISLNGLNDFMIPTFGGTFEGNGHKIMDLSITSSNSPAGLFGTLQASASVSGLTVEGNIVPSGTAENIGGITGINEGRIRDCSFYGTVSGTRNVGGIAGTNSTSGRILTCSAGGGIFGSRMTGGIAGCSHGMIYFCSGNTFVNTRSIDPGLSVSDLHLDLNVFADVNRLMSLDTYNIASDTGGIAGFSDGAVIGCINNGTVGYQHLGYNVGGIAGRTRGLVSGVRNNGTVYGRKDVGGISGMAEPSVSVDLTEDKLKEIEDELHSLNDMVDRASKDLDQSSASINAQVSQLTGQISQATLRADDLSGKLKTYTNGTVDEVNRGSGMLDTALSDLSDVTGTLGDSSGHLEDSATDIREAVREVQTDTADEKTLKELDEALQDIRRASDIEAAGSLKIREGEAVLKSFRSVSSSETGGNISIIMENGPEDAGPDMSVDLTPTGTLDERIEKIREGSSLIREGIGILKNGRGGESGDEGGAVYYMNRASGRLSNTDLKLNENAVNDVSRSANSLRSGMDDLQSALSATEHLLDYLNGEDPLYFSPVGQDITDSADALYSSMQQISDSLAALSSSTGSSTGTLTDDIRQMNDQFRKVTDLVIDRIYDTEDPEIGDIVQDASDDIDPDSVTNGKMILCRNSGYVYGDLNTGGIAGSMAIFDELDPEGDSADDLTGIYHRRYELKCILLNCENSGKIVSKRSNAGGICGYAQLGLISDCVNDGTVSGEDGDYIGGIAGTTDNIIRRCYAKTRLSGRDYIGGIAGGTLSGAAISETNPEIKAAADESGTNSILERCTAIPQIVSSRQYTGAVSGSDKGTFLNNVFVSDDLGGINGLSIQGLAEPVEYESLLADPLLPQQLRSFRLDFVADDKIVKSAAFSYGESFHHEDIPAIPEKDGYYAYWETGDRRLEDQDGPAEDPLSSLKNDTVVTAVYLPYVTAVKSGPTRSESRPVFFAEGSFDDRAVLKAEPAVFPFTPAKGGVFRTLKNYNREILEQWHLKIPADTGTEASASHVIRYLLPTGAGSHCELYIRTPETGRTSDGWQLIKPGHEGSYLCFPVTGEDVDLTVMSARTPVWIWFVLGGIVFAIIVLILRDIYVRIQAAKEPSLSGNAASKGESGNAAYSGLPVKKGKRKPPLRTRIRRHAIAILVLILLLFGSTAVIIQKAPGVTDGMGLYLMLRNYFARSDIEMELDVDADLDQESFHTEASIYTTSSNDRRVTAVDWQGIPVYYCDGMMILENGKAFRLGSGIPDYSSLAGTALPLFRSMKISSSELNGVRTYHAAATGEDADRILSTLIPVFSGNLPESAEVDVDLVMTDADLTSISFSWNGTLDGAKGQTEENVSPAKQANVSARMSFQTSSEPHTIPQMVDSVIRSSKTADISDPGDDIRRLFTAFVELSALDPVAADVTVQASCGPFLVNDSFDYRKSGRYGRDIAKISRSAAGTDENEDSLTLYASDGRISSGEGFSTGVAHGYSADTWKLVRMAYTACMEGDASCSETPEGRLYQITLGQDAVRALSDMVVPEARSLPLNIQDGSVSVLISEDQTKKHGTFGQEPYRVSSITLSAGGETAAGILTVPVSMNVRMDFHPTSENFEVPDAVLRQFGAGAYAGDPGRAGDNAAGQS